MSPGLNCSSAILIVPGLRCRGPDNTKEHRLASAGSFVSDEHAFVYRVGANRLKVVSKTFKAHFTKLLRLRESCLHLFCPDR